MAKIVIHAGFHKTATTTVQRFFWHNRRAIWRKMGYPSPDKFEPIWRAAGGYSTHQSKPYLAKVYVRTRQFFKTRDIHEDRDVFMSSERLSGHMPGRLGLPDYSSVPPLMLAMDRAVSRAFPKHEVIYYFSTRERSSWLQSAYAQHVKGSLMRLDFDEFVTAFPNAANFDEVIATLRDKLGAKRVIAQDYKTNADTRFGPATPILTLFDLPERFLNGLEPVKSANLRLPDELTAACLAINRRFDTPDEAKHEKDALIREYFQNAQNRV